MMGTARITLIGVLAIAILANVVQFQSIDSVAPQNYQAVNRNISSNIVEIVSQDTAVKNIYGPYWALSEHQPDAVIRLSADDAEIFPLLQFVVMGYGRADSFSLASESLADVTSLDELLASPAVYSTTTGLASGHGHSEENWYYIRGECSRDDPSELVIGHLMDETDHALVFADSCLLPNGGLSE
ncbi:hypothetical protein I6E68_12155 [Salinibacterium sp. NSLL150]|uniref:hypothetical protein n=1 Tax=unclassified Salinibacterium TaxID=2632331 RepID=UPI0018CE56DB|nr:MULTISPECIES: hypothetical protein [unclassified Salinibacterium]MBH0099887.1 hypothetical protein [Salinibacterium sp. NSLL35]MBH0102641.1 hypothetical protein [Salinibacterium sp. NSLL150]MBH0105401.1 hypothetical protein [Salinibacterium sp. NSLL16]MBH0108161.1 hypothetical protein [Salinibacterium sp. NSLL17]